MNLCDARAYDGGFGKYTFGRGAISSPELTMRTDQCTTIQSKNLQRNQPFGSKTVTYLTPSCGS